MTVSSFTLIGANPQTALIQFIVGIKSGEEILLFLMVNKHDKDNAIWLLQRLYRGKWRYSLLVTYVWDRCEIQASPIHHVQVLPSISHSDELI